MPHSRRVAYSAEEIAKRFALFVPHKGIVRFGHTIPGIAPMSEMVNKSRSGGALPTSEVVTPEEFNSALFSRIFCCFHSKPKDIKNTVALLMSSGLTPRVVCSPQDREYLIRSGIGDACVTSEAQHAFPSEDSVALIYHKELSRLDFRTLQAHLICSEGEEHGIHLLLSNLMTNARLVERASGADNKFFVAKYNSSQKPKNRKLLDSVFYMDRWSLLSNKEKTLRCVGSVLLTLIMPIMPLVFAFLSRGKDKKANYDIGVTPWQWHSYQDMLKKASSPYDMLFGGDEEAVQRLVSAATKVALEPDFGYMDENHEPTEKAKQVSRKHNFLLLASGKQLSNKDFALRIGFLAVVAILAISSIAQLSLHSMSHPGASVASAISYGIVVCVCMGAIYTHRKDTKKVVAFGILAFVCAAFLANAAITFHLGNPSGAVAEGLDTMISSTMVILSIVYGIAARAMNVIHKKDKKVADELGVGVTAYLNMRTKLHSELKDRNLETVKAEVLVKVLEDNGIDVSALLTEQNAGSHSAEPDSEIQQQPSTSGSTSAQVHQAEAQQSRATTVEGGTGAPHSASVSSSLSDAAAQCVASPSATHAQGTG
ncbi:hypothetical protein [Anaplasma capra]|uniref:hypothetical protein n=1 Tax=Anaplasma capra TaxID=1562740 RepID=UPI0021D57F02|nr:hypothetical protein [Anaplasma capra]MCU7611157.1 hypothetical protein [Anaplasma capra]